MKISSKTIRGLLLFFLILLILFVILDSKEDNRIYSILKYLSAMGMVVCSVIYGKVKKLR